METKDLTLTKKDYFFSLTAGILIGLLILPVLKAAYPIFYENYSLPIFLFFFVGTPLGTIVSNFIGRKLIMIWQVAKFGVIGVMNTLVDLGLLTLTTFAFKQYFHIASSDLVITGFVLTYYSLFKAFSFITANVNSYFWNKYWTFEKNSLKKSATEFLQFFIVSVVGLAVNVLFASLFVTLAPFGGLTSDQIGLLGGAAGSIAGLAWNFIGYKFIVFKQK